MPSRMRFWLEAGAALSSASLLVGTLLEPRWFEWLFDEAPDGGDGALESGVALVVFLATTAWFSFRAQREWRRAHRA